MKILHLADLHIGKRVNEFSMIEDQKYILKIIINEIKKESIETVLICGDVYDKSIPGIEAVNLFNDFLNDLYQLNINVFIISGNHDSAERLGFGSTIFNNANIHIVSTIEDKIPCISLNDNYGKVNFYLLPFLKPVHVRKYYEDVNSYDEAIKALLDNTALKKDERNIILVHQFVVSDKNPDTSDSEVKSLGGLDSISASLFKDFDYVALGHIHKPQNMGSNKIRYAGSILKYSFSEANIDKTLTILDFKDDITIKQIPLVPLHDMKRLESNITAILNKETLDEVSVNDYVEVILKDEEEIIDAIGKVRSIYPNVMSISIDNKKTRAIKSKLNLNKDDIKLKNTIELFNDFYQMQNNIELNANELSLIESILKEDE